jgi:hypothetical protein
VEGKINVDGPRLWLLCAAVVTIVLVGGIRQGAAALQATEWSQS